MSSVANPTPTPSSVTSPTTSPGAEGGKIRQIRVESASSQALLSNFTPQFNIPSSPVTPDQSPRRIDSSVKKVSSDFSLTQSQSALTSPSSSLSVTSNTPEKANNANDDILFDKLLFAQPLFAEEYNSANWERSLSCIDDVDFAESTVSHVPPACPRRLRCPVCAFLDKVGRGFCESEMGSVASKFGWIIDRNEEVDSILKDFRTKKVNKEMADRLKEVIKMLKDQLSEAVDGIFESEMATVSRFEKKQAKINYRYRILNEIASTEKDYYNSLTIIKNTWKMDFVASGLLTDDEINRIFYNIDDLVDTANKMIKKIEVEKEKEYYDQMVGKIFVDLVPDLKGYVEYCPMQDSAQRIYYSLMKSNSKFKELVAKTRFDKHQTTKGQDLPAFLIKPTQRITRYPLFLKDLIKHTDTDHPDYPSLLQAEIAIKKFLEDINIRTRQQVTRDTIEKLKPNIIWRSERILDFEKSQCTFITESKTKCVYQLGNSPEKGRHIVLFDSVLLVLHRSHRLLKEVAIIPVETITEVIDNDDPENSPIKPPNASQPTSNIHSPMINPSNPQSQQISPLTTSSPTSLSPQQQQQQPSTTLTASTSSTAIVSSNATLSGSSNGAASGTVTLSNTQSAITNTATLAENVPLSTTEPLTMSAGAGPVALSTLGTSTSPICDDASQQQQQNEASSTLPTSLPATGTTSTMPVANRLGANIPNSITIVTNKGECVVMKPKEESEKQHLLMTLEEIVSNFKKTKLHPLVYATNEHSTTAATTTPSLLSSSSATLSASASSTVPPPLTTSSSGAITTTTTTTSSGVPSLTSLANGGPVQPSNTATGSAKSCDEKNDPNTPLSLVSSPPSANLHRREMSVGAGDTELISEQSGLGLTHSHGREHKKDIKSFFSLRGKTRQEDPLVNSHSSGRDSDSEPSSEKIPSSPQQTPQESSLQLTPPVVVLNSHMPPPQSHKHGKSMQLPQASQLSLSQQQQQQQQQDQQLQPLQKTPRNRKGSIDQDRKAKKITFFSGLRRNPGQGDELASNSPTMAVAQSPKEGPVDTGNVHVNHRKVNSSSMMQVIPPPKILTPANAVVVSNPNTNSSGQQETAGCVGDGDSQQIPADQQQTMSKGTINGGAGGSSSIEENETDIQSSRPANTDSASVGVNINVNANSSNANANVGIGSSEQENQKNKKKRVVTSHFHSLRKKKHNFDNGTITSVQLQPQQLQSKGDDPYQLPARMAMSQSPPPMTIVSLSPNERSPTDVQATAAASASASAGSSNEGKSQEQSLPPLPSVPDQSDKKERNLTPRPTPRKDAIDDSGVVVEGADEGGAHESDKKGKKDKKHGFLSLRKSRAVTEEEGNTVMTGGPKNEGTSDGAGTEGGAKRPEAKRNKKRLGFRSLRKKSDRFADSEPPFNRLDITVASESGNGNHQQINLSDEISVQKDKESVDIPPPPLTQSQMHSHSLSMSVSLTPSQKVSHLRQQSVDIPPPPLSPPSLTTLPPPSQPQSNKKTTKIKLNPKSPRQQYLDIMPPTSPPPPPPPPTSQSSSSSSPSSLHYENPPSSSSSSNNINNNNNSDNNDSIPPPQPLQSQTSQTTLETSKSSSSSTSITKQQVTVPSLSPLQLPCSPRSPRQLKMPCSMQRPTENPPPPPTFSSQLQQQISAYTTSSLSSQQSQQSFGTHFLSSSSVSGEDSDGMSSTAGSGDVVAPPPPPKCVAPSPPPPPSSIQPPTEPPPPPPPSPPTN